jgi:hypothetical protein
MEKRKVGRPKKVVAPTPKIKVNYREAYLQALEVIEDLHQQIEKADERKAVWIDKAKEEYQKAIAIISLVKEQIDTTIDALVQVEVTTGKITSFDAIYHVGMIERVVEAKVNSENEE